MKQENFEIHNRKGKASGVAAAPSVPVAGAGLTDGAKVALVIGAATILFAFIGCVAKIGDNTTTNKPATLSTNRPTSSNREVRTETKTESLSFGIERSPSASLEEGSEQITQQGSNGEQLYTYEVTYENGKEVSRKLVGSIVSKAPVNSIVAYGTKPKPAPAPPGSSSGCDPNYSGCVPIASDVDCAGGSGDGPAYTGTVNVIGYDKYGLDRDGDRIACE